MSQSLRQKPPKDRSAAYAALIVAGLLLAGCVGWMANSMLNGGKGNSKNESAQVANKDMQAEAEPLTPSDLNKDELTKKDDASKTIEPTKKDRKDDREKERMKTSTLDDSKLRSSKSDDLDPLELEKKLSTGPPKLSELDSFKKNPNKTRVKAPGTNRRKYKTDTTQRDPKSDSKTSSQYSSGQKEKRAPSKESSAKSSGQDNQFAFQQSTSDLVFYQELIVDRNPIFGIEGISALNQKFKYRTVSKITVHPGKNGFRKVSQKVVGANLISADSISKKSIEESVKKLIGKEFQFTLDKKQKVVDFKGEKEPPKSIDFKDLTSIDGFKGDGFMVSSVMDLDGWREMAQLTFLLPDDKKKKWSDQMEHDWGELGRWVGETRFEKKGESNGKLRIDYAHYMRYETAPKGESKLPFTLGEIAMESKEAGGRMFFDREKRRIDSLIERFQVSGSIGASLLGGSTKLKIQETQTFELKLHDQNPQ